MRQRYRRKLCKYRPAYTAMFLKTLAKHRDKLIDVMTSSNPFFNVLRRRAFAELVKCAEGAS